MTTSLFLFSVPFFSLIFSSFLYVVFGQVTVRKLRKNPKTKNVLGLEFASGWDIFNVSQSLSIPRSWARKLEKKAAEAKCISVIAKSDLLYEHTNIFDRFLARLHFWVGWFGVITMLIFAVLHYAGIVSPES